LFLTPVVGFGKRFVSFDSAASAEAAIQGLNNVAVGGRRLKVLKASRLYSILISFPNVEKCMNWNSAVS
jgi:hypothetical protein